jgi:hypothetical protein
VSDSEIWDAYNTLLLSPDVERIRKLVARYELFKMSIQVPGDIVECGVFKGAGLLYWLKLLSIFAPGSIKRVVGFDTFGPLPDSLGDAEKPTFEQFFNEADWQSGAPESLRRVITDAGFESRVELVKGDVTQTAAAYASAHPGFRISLLHLDLDSYEGTRAALEHFFPLVVKGGVIVFDEYADPTWCESQAVDEYFRDRAVELRTLSFAHKPTAYVIKS